MDDDCDGATNEDGAGCVCLPDELVDCYAGPAGTEGVGDCRAGSATCDAWGTSLGACAGEVLPGVEDCDQAGDEDCDGVACSATRWGFVAGSTGMEVLGGLAVDSAGDVILGAGFRAELTIGADTFSSPDGADGLILKLGSDGSYRWGVQLGDGPAGNTAQMIWAITTDDAGAIYIAGTFQGSFTLGAELLESNLHQDVFVAKLDPQGQVVWARQLSCTGCGTNPSDGDKAVGALALTDDAVVVVGHYRGDFGGPGPCIGGFCAVPWAADDDPFVALLARDDGLVVDVAYSKGVGTDKAMRVVVDSAGEIVVAGTFSSDHDVTPLDPAGGSWSSEGARDIFVIKYDAALSPLWHMRLGDVFTDEVGGLALDQQDNPLVVGSLGNSLHGNELFVYKLPRDSGVLGTGSMPQYPLAERLFDDAPASSLKSTGAMVDGDGDLIIVGALSGSAALDGHAAYAAGAMDAVVVKLDADLATSWVRSIGSEGADMGMAVALGADDSILIGGINTASIDLGDGPRPFAGDMDLFVAALNP